MVRKVYFSFHFDRDARRVAIVRNSPVMGSYDKPAFLDHVAFEEVRRKGDAAIKKWIDDNLWGTSVTIVLIDAETYTRPWVLYEIEQSNKKGIALLGITLHNINDPLIGKDKPGPSPFNYIKDKGGKELVYTVPEYDWVYNDGRENIGKWIETAALKAGRV